MNWKQLIYAVIISALIGGIFTLGQSIVFGGGTTYLYDDDYKNIEEMKYSEALDYLAERAREISGFESFKNGVKYPQFWKYFAVVWLYYTALGFLCCFVYAFASKRGKDAI